MFLCSHDLTVAPSVGWPRHVRMEVIKEFLESSTIHGLVYISTARHPVRILWLFVIIAGFTGSGVLIQQSFSSWADSPVSTTIETLPITDLVFPNVTVCPPRNSFTSLNPDLVMSRDKTLSQEARSELSGAVKEAIFVEDYKSKLEEFNFYRQQDYINWYTGITEEDCQSNQ